MDHFRDFLNKFNSSDELRRTAIQLKIDNLPTVQNKIHELILEETLGVPLDQQIVHQVLNDPQATQQVIKELERMQESLGNTVDNRTPHAAESEPPPASQKRENMMLRTLLTSGKEKRKP